MFRIIRGKPSDLPPSAVNAVREALTKDLEGRFINRVTGEWLMSVSVTFVRTIFADPEAEGGVNKEAITKFLDHFFDGIRGVLAKEANENFGEAEKMFGAENQDLREGAEVYGKAATRIVNLFRHDLEINMGIRPDDKKDPH